MKKSLKPKIDFPSTEKLGKNKKRFVKLEIIYFFILQSISQESQIQKKIIKGRFFQEKKTKKEKITRTSFYFECNFFPRLSHYRISQTIAQLTCPDE